MASMYSAKVMEHFANPHNVGEIPDANGVGEVGNPKCGDIMRMYLKIENNVIVDVKFLTFGCGAAIATSSMATDLIKGKTIDEALKLTNKAVVEALEGLPPIKVHCSVLAEQAVKAALSDYYRRQGIDPEPIVGKLEEDCDHCESCGHRSPQKTLQRTPILCGVLFFAKDCTVVFYPICNKLTIKYHKFIKTPCLSTRS